MDGYFPHRKSAITWLRPWTPEENMDGVSVSEEDRDAGSPKAGDQIAINPDNPADRWLVSAAYYAANYELAEQDPS